MQNYASPCFIAHSVEESMLLKFSLSQVLIDTVGYQPARKVLPVIKCTVVSYY